MNDSDSIHIPNRPEKDRIKSSFSPITRFTAEHKQKQLAYAFAFFCLILALAAQVITIRSMQADERVFVIDGGNNLHIGPLENANSSSPLFQTLAIVAIQVIFDRSPVGLDLRELKGHLFTREAARVLEQDVASSLDELKAKSLHQKAEISLIKTLAEKNGVRYLYVKGNLIGSGVFEGAPIMEAHQFAIHLAVKANPKLSEKKMYPYLVADYVIKEMTPL